MKLRILKNNLKFEKSLDSMLLEKEISIGGSDNDSSLKPNSNGDDNAKSGDVKKPETNDNPIDRLSDDSLNGSNAKIPSYIDEADPEKYPDKIKNLVEAFNSISKYLEENFNGLDKGFESNPPTNDIRDEANKKPFSYIANFSSLLNIGIDDNTFNDKIKDYEEKKQKKDNGESIEDFQESPSIEYVIKNGIKYDKIDSVLLSPQFSILKDMYGKDFNIKSIYNRFVYDLIEFLTGDDGRKSKELEQLKDDDGKPKPSSDEYKNVKLPKDVKVFSENQTIESIISDLKPVRLSDSMRDLLKPIYKKFSIFGPKRLSKDPMAEIKSMPDISEDLFGNLDLNSADEKKTNEGYAYSSFYDLIINEASEFLSEGNNRLLFDELFEDKKNTEKKTDSPAARSLATSIDDYVSRMLPEVKVLLALAKDNAGDEFLNIVNDQTTNIFKNTRDNDSSDSDNDMKDSNSSNSSKKLDVIDNTKEIENLKAKSESFIKKLYINWFPRKDSHGNRVQGFGLLWSKDSTSSESFANKIKNFLIREESKSGHKSFDSWLEDFASISSEADLDKILAETAKSCSQHDWNILNQEYNIIRNNQYLKNQNSSTNANPQNIQTSIQDLNMFNALYNMFVERVTQSLKSKTLLSEQDLLRLTYTDSSTNKSLSLKDVDILAFIVDSFYKFKKCLEDYYRTKSAKLRQKGNIVQFEKEDNKIEIPEKYLNELYKYVLELYFKKFYFITRDSDQNEDLKNFVKEIERVFKDDKDDRVNLWKSVLNSFNINNISPIKNRLETLQKIAAPLVDDVPPFDKLSQYFSNAEYADLDNGNLKNFLSNKEFSIKNPEEVAKFIKNMFRAVTGLVDGLTFVILKESAIISFDSDKALFERWGRDDESEIKSNALGDFNRVRRELVKAMSNSILSNGSVRDWNLVKEFRKQCEEIHKEVDNNVKNRIKIRLEGDKKSGNHLPIRANTFYTLWDTYSKELYSRIAQKEGELIYSESFKAFYEVIMIKIPTVLAILISLRRVLRNPNETIRFR